MASAANAAEPVARPFSQALVPLFFLSALFFLNFSARVIFSPLLPGIEQEFGLDHSGAGSFFSAYLQRLFHFYPCLSLCRCPSWTLLDHNPVGAGLAMLFARQNGKGRAITGG